LHEPVKAEDCRPNKALRTTIKVFLKKKGIEREAARKKEMIDQAAAAPALPAIPHVDETSDLQPSQTPVVFSVGDAEATVDPTQSLNEVSHLPENGNSLGPNNSAQIPPEEAQMDIARPSIEVSVSVQIRDCY